MSTTVPLSAAERMEKIVSLCKRKGFIFQSSEIYGGFNGFWDYGPLGAELKRNLRERWWLAMTREREDVVGLDATIVMHPAIWKASGHVDTFADSMRESTLSNKRVRADHVEPQSGNVLEFSGARTAAGWNLGKPIRVLLRKGEHIESLRKRVKALLASVNSVVAEEIELLDEQNTGAVENSVDFHAEDGGALGEARPFNLMMRTWVGPTATDADIAYLRPETAQAIFAQFKNVVDSSRVKVPFGICQIGKAFRNEVTPRNYTFRSREFEQMELEFFIRPDEAIQILCGKVTPWTAEADLSEPQPDWGWEMWHRYWVAERTRFYVGIGLGEALEYFHQPKEDLAHYARACVDILFRFPFKTDELEGIAARGAFDLTQHQMHSGKPQEVFDDELKAAAGKLGAEEKEAMIRKRLVEEQAKECALGETEVRAWFDRLFAGFYVPHVIEPSAGLDRLALAILCHAFAEETVNDAKGNPETRTVMRFHPRVAPVKVAILPLLKNKPPLVAKAREIYQLLRRDFAVDFDDGGAIGRRYRRQDEIGTPFCVTIDFETLGEKGPEMQDTVTLRHRDSMQQERVAIADLPARLRAALA